MKFLDDKVLSLSQPIAVIRIIFTDCTASNPSREVYLRSTESYVSCRAISMRSLRLVWLEACSCCSW